MQSVKKGILLCCFLLTCIPYIEAKDTWKKKKITKYVLITISVGVCGVLCIKGMYQLQKSIVDKKSREQRSVDTTGDEEKARIKKNTKSLKSFIASHTLQKTRRHSGALNSLVVEDEKSTGGATLHTTDDAEETMQRRLGSLGVDFDPASWVEQLQEGLNDALPHIRRAKGKDCVILIGNTGVGKSTLINALYNGVEHIEEVEVSQGDEFGFGEAFVTELAPKQAIQDEQGNILFGVGSGNQSVTSYIEIAEQRGIAFCDCPGFGDTRGGMFDLINCISMGELFIKARSVQICYLMTEGDIMNASGRGNTIKELLETVSSVFKDNQQGQQLITYDNLKKLRFIITNLSGNTKKVNLMRDFGRILNEKISNIDDNKTLADLLKKNVFLIDAKDRPSKFVPGESMDKVADLKQKLVALDSNMLYHPNVLKDPITFRAKERINKVLKLMQDRAMDILSDKNIFKPDTTSQEIEVAFKAKLDQLDKEVEKPLLVLSQYGVVKPFTNSVSEMIDKRIECIKSRKKQYEEREDLQEQLVRIVTGF